MWLERARSRHARSFQDDANPNSRRIHIASGPLHYEDQIDSGRFETDVDMRLADTATPQLRGLRVGNNQWHFGYQVAPSQQAQQPQGTIGFGGRKGANWLFMRPDSIGWMHWPTRTFTPITLNAPVFADPVVTEYQSSHGKNETAWIQHSGFKIETPAVWSLGGTPIDWLIESHGSHLKQKFIVPQAARAWIAANSPVPSLASETFLCARYAIDWRGIGRARLKGANADLRDLEDDGKLLMEDAQGRALGHFSDASVWVRGVGGRAGARKRFYREGQNDYFIVGVNAAEMQSALLDGDLVIDPAITQEGITTGSDDAQHYQGLSAALGGGNTNCANPYTATGVRFQTVPIPQGATINSASLTFYFESSPTGLTINVTADDRDNAPTFEANNGANSVWNRTGTTAYANVNVGSFSAYQDNALTGLASVVQEIVDRSGWASNNAIAFMLRPQGSGGVYLTAYETVYGSRTPARFDASYTAGGGGGVVPPTLQVLGRNFSGHIVSRMGGHRQ